MSTALLLDGIMQRSIGRFQLQTHTDFTVEIVSIAAEPLVDRCVVRLRRNSTTGNAGWRTLLLASFENISLLRDASRWAANVRDILTEPETADLYLILVIAELSTPECYRIEADEKFCRKYVMRPTESVSDLLDRTFLSGIIRHGTEETLFDPVAAAFRHTEASHPWFDQTQQSAWRAALLSGQTGSDLATALLDQQSSSEADSL